MPRPVWSGTISFGLVTIPVKLFHAVSRKNVSFNQLDDRSMSRIRMKKVSAETGEDVPDEHIVKGYEVAKGRYVVVDPDELEPFIPAATKAIDLEEFVDLAEIDPVFFDTPYIVAPDNAAKPYMLLTKAMEDAGKVAVGTFVMRSKQYVAALRPSTAASCCRRWPSPTRWSTRHHRRARRPRRRQDQRQGAGHGRAARGVPGRRLRARPLQRQLPRAGAGPHRQEGGRRGVRGARARRRGPAGHRPHGRARGQRQGGQGRTRSPSRHRQGRSRPTTSGAADRARRTRTRRGSRRPRTARTRARKSA